MKRNVLFGILAVLTVFGCQVNEEGELAPEGKVFTATMETLVDDASGVETKTSLDSRGNVLWKQGDQVSIFAGSTINEQYQVTDASDGKTAAALNRVTSPGFVAGTEIQNNVAFYPYGELAEIAKDGSTYIISGIELTATQNYASASFGNGAFPMVAVTSSTQDYNLKFKNVLGGLKLQLTGTATIKAISITGNNNEILCGDAEVTVSTTTAPSISLTDASATTVTLDCGDGVQLNETTATAFIIALPPMNMNGGFTVTVTDTYGAAMVIKTTKTQIITRSNILSMPPIEATAFIPTTGTDNGYEWVDLGLPSGLKWATCNVGSNTPEEYGDYFSWGETSTKDTYNWSTYCWCNGSESTLTKYNTKSAFGEIVDNKIILEEEDDAARANWGGQWRMPTWAEMAELIDSKNCTTEWVVHNGKNVRRITSKRNGNSIYMTDGYYLSSSVFTGDDLTPGGNNNLVVGIDVVASHIGLNCGLRYNGHSVRPVTDQGLRVSVSAISIDNTKLSLFESETASITATVLPSNATQPVVIWSSSNTSVATVSWEGVVTAVAPGSATITATTYDGGFTAKCSVTVKTVPEAVDLGLTSGLKWASFNVGANAPEEYGDYFAWGATEPFYTEGHSQDNPCCNWKANKTGYDWINCPFRTSGDSWDNVQFSKYNTIIDDNTVLDPEDDAAHVNWGGSWRMPTDEDWTELRIECTWTWKGEGYQVTGPNGISIFLPAAGRRYETFLYDTGRFGFYWSSSLGTDYPSGVFYVDFTSSGFSRNGSHRCLGFSVRPVTE